MMLDQDPDEALERAEDRAMEHQRIVLAAVGSDVGCLETLGHLWIELQSPALPGTPNRVLEVKLELWTVEGSLPRKDLIIEPRLP